MKQVIATDPYLLSEWDYAKNAAVNLDPNILTLGSGKKAWWICPHGHSYDMVVNKRANTHQGCPYCSGHRFQSGINDFQTRFPDLAAEWHPVNNGSLKPSDIYCASPQKYWWKCPVGHSYQATARDRGVDHTNCPVCNRRKQTSFPEQALYFYIKKIYPNAINSYRDIFTNGMELDIFIPEINYGIEYDGKAFHHTPLQVNREETKFQICQEHHIKLIRVKEGTWTPTTCFSSNYTFYIEHPKDENNLAETFQQILNVLDPATNLFTRKNPFHIFSDTIIDISKDRNQILKAYLTDIPNSLKKIRPDVIQMWNYDRNKPLTPEMFTVHSNEKVWWKCPQCGHEWQSQINSMTKPGRIGCAVCAKSIRGKTQTHNALKTRALQFADPKILSEFDSEKNSITPSEITVGSAKAVWWKCHVCGYSWKTSPCNRISKGCGCPHCSGRVPIPGVDDLATVNPALAAEWDNTKNTFSPTEVLPKSGKTAHWKCQNCGYEWASVIRDRTNGSPCPKCKNHITRLKIPK